MHNNEKHPALTPEEITRGMLKCRNNAISLIEEAILLANHGRSERAYLLAHSACEEFAKFFILKIAGQLVCQGKQPEWKRFWKRFRSHDSKMSQLDVQFSTVDTDSDESVNDLISSLDIFLSKGLFIRNASLYVDIGRENTFRSPSEIGFDTPFPAMIEAANMASRLAAAAGRTEEELFKRLHIASSAEEKAATAKALLLTIEKLKLSGASREEVEKLINKSFYGSC